MPTVRPRHAITETDVVAAALEAAARRWPEDRDLPARLLAHLVEIGFHTIEIELEDETEKRRAAIRKFAGSFTGLFGPGYLDEVREGWPE